MVTMATARSPRRRFVAALHACLASNRGGMAVITALTLPVLIGVMGLGTEVSFWYLHQRAMQNAADAAAIAAATNAGANYATEAKAVALNLGFQDGTGTIKVTATNPATATNCTKNCYVVTVSDTVPMFLSEIVGYTGNGSGSTGIAASAVATSSKAYNYCVLALAGSGKEGIRTNGAPKADLGGCNTMSNTTSTCNGSNLNADAGDAVGTNDGCGIQQNSNVTAVSDPYSGLASNIPANPCSSYAQEPTSVHGHPLPPSNQWSGSKSISGNKVVCGDLQLSGNTTITADGGVLVIENGQLDTNGFTFAVAAGSSLTVVFTGTNSASYTYSPTGGGTIDITPPTTGPWAGVAIYQDPNLTKGVDMAAAGNAPTWNIGGLVYLPHSNVTFSGAVNKDANGTQCFVMVVDTLLINGTSSIFKDHNNCEAAGLTPPNGGHRGVLVY
jgi:Flp pilus assembly protein TadG